MVTNQRFRRDARGCGPGKFRKAFEPKRKRRILIDFKQSG